MIRYFWKNWLLVLAVVGLVSCTPKTFYKESTHTVQLSVDSTMDPCEDTTFTNMVNHYKIGLDSIMNKVIGYCDVTMKGGKPESILTNYVSDLYLELGRQYCKDHSLNYMVDISIMNVYGLRTVIPVGPVTVGRIFELMPFENRLVLVSLKGDKLKELLDHIAHVGGEGVSGMKMGIKDGKAINVNIGGLPLDRDKLYHIVSIDYLIRGGDGMKAFADHVSYLDMNMKCREAIMKYVSDSHQKGVHLTSKLDGRIYYEQ